MPYHVAEIPVSNDGDILSTSFERIAAAMVVCVDVEGPIHQDLLTRRITSAWGHQRAGTRIMNHIQAAQAVAVRREEVIQRGAFLWSAERATVVPRGALPDGTVREIAHIADEEIVTAMTRLLDRVFSLTQDDLILQTARLLKYQRTGADISGRLQSVIALGVASRALTAQDDRLRLRRSS